MTWHRCHGALRGRCHADRRGHCSRTAIRGIRQSGGAEFHSAYQMLTLGRGTTGSRIVPELCSPLDMCARREGVGVRTIAYLAGDRSFSGRFAARPGGLVRTMMDEMSGMLKTKQRSSGGEGRGIPFLGSCASSSRWSAPGAAARCCVRRRLRFWTCSRVFQRFS